MVRIFIALILLLPSLVSIAQKGPKSIGPSVNDLLDDAAHGFANSKGVYVKSDTLNDYYMLKNKSDFKCNEFIIVKKSNKQSIYTCTFDLKDGNGVFIDGSMNTLIAWAYNMEELGKKTGYRFEPKPTEKDGFVFSLYDGQSLLIAEAKHDGKTGSVIVFEKKK
jgi:hypothetical protein